MLVTSNAYFSHNVFMPPHQWIRGHVVFGCLFVCLSAKTFSLVISFDWKELGPSYFT